MEMKHGLAGVFVVVYDQLSLLAPLLLLEGKEKGNGSLCFLGKLFSWCIELEYIYVGLLIVFQLLASVMQDLEIAS